MCRDCRHWRVERVIIADGIAFAPCALKPDKLVRDRRTRDGLEEQTYRMASTYVCKQFSAQETSP